MQQAARTAQVLTNRPLLPAAGTHGDDLPANDHITRARCRCGRALVIRGACRVSRERGGREQRSRRAMRALHRFAVRAVCGGVAQLGPRLTIL